MKKILLVDDSALLRKVMCDIIDADDRFTVEDQAANGEIALELLKKKQYDGVILDVNMPVMDGLQLLRALKENNISANVLMASTRTRAGEKVTLESLELGAIDYIQKPEWSFRCKDDEFKNRLLELLQAVCESKKIVPKKTEEKDFETIRKLAQKAKTKTDGEKIVAIAVSTGGPKSLQNVIPLLPANLNAPVMIVQHMPEGFTASLASRLDSMSEMKVVEAAHGMEIEKGCVYIAKAGQHMNIAKSGRKNKIILSDEPTREGVRPCANYMYESLINSNYDEVLCIVMTGMGADGTAGIRNLKDSGKKAHVMVQKGESCVVNGMPKACTKAGLSDQVVDLADIAQEILLHVGVK